jgi:hypothetical protein
LALALSLAVASEVSAQAALAATSVSTDKLPPISRLTLRPAPGLEALARKVARVLALRSHTTVEIGSAPPPGLLEAVSAGNVALERREGSIRLVMGAAFGASFDARVDLLPNGADDPRALALAIEALRDRAIESREHRELDHANALVPPPSDRAVNDEALLAPESEARPPPVETSEPAPQPTAAERPNVPNRRVPARDQSNMLDGDPRDPRDRGAASRPPPSERGLKVQPMLYLGMYGGASTASNALRTGIATGGGLCVQGQCLLLAVEYPLPISLEAGGGDIRYRYPTFSCSFYSHLFTIGRFTPAVSVGLLSRIGHFERDMGLTDYQSGLDTDLAMRGTVQGAFEVIDSVDIVAEAGLDYALDRFQFGNGDTLAYRGPRTSPWLQAGVRIRPE